MDQLCITLALKLENAGAVAVIQALCVLFSFILSITVVGETIHLTSAFGGALIFLSVIILAGAKWYSELEAYSMFGSRASLNTTLSSSSSIDHHFEVNLKSYVQYQNPHNHHLSLKPVMEQSNDISFVPIVAPTLSIDRNVIDSEQNRIPKK